MPLLQWHIKSTTKAQQGLYEYDAVSRLRDSQLGDEKRQGHPELHRQGRAVAGLHRRQPVALLIDEIDKADIEFPNDLLRELDRMEFYCYETREMIRAKHRPLVFITSNNEKSCPTPSCAAASSTTSSSPKPTPCARSWTCTSPRSRASC
jgi:MoxR-like ATPase